MRSTSANSLLTAATNISLETHFCNGILNVQIPFNGVLMVIIVRGVAS